MSQCDHLCIVAMTTEDAGKKVSLDLFVKQEARLQFSLLHTFGKERQKETRRTLALKKQMEHQAPSYNDADNEHHHLSLHYFRLLKVRASEVHFLKRTTKALFLELCTIIKTTRLAVFRLFNTMAWISILNSSSQSASEKTLLAICPLQFELDCSQTSQAFKTANIHSGKKRRILTDFSVFCLFIIYTYRRTILSNTKPLNPMISAFYELCIGVTKTQSHCFTK